MNELIKNSIDARKNAIYNAYEINDDKEKDKINDLFNRIEEFAKKYEDLGEFEANFASSPLNQEYIDLFTFVATNYKAKEYKQSETITNNNNEVLDEIGSEAKYLVDDLTHPARHAAREKFDSQLRDIPVVGDAIQAKQTFDLFNKFKKNKKDED